VIDRLTNVTILGQ